MIYALGESHCQTVGMRTNVFYLLTTTPNVGLDVCVSSHSTLSVSVGYKIYNFVTN